MKKLYYITGISLVVIGILTGLVVVSQPKPTPTHNASQTVDTSPDIDTLWYLTNQERAKHGLAPLVLDPRLTASSTAKCLDMIKYAYWAHISPTGVTPQDMIQQVLSQPITDYYSGENLSIGYATSDAVTNAWIASPGHEANIVNPHYVDVGYAICTNSQSKIMVVQEFLSNPV